MRILSTVLAALVVVALTAAPARAQSYFSPFIGYDTGGDAGTCLPAVSSCDQKKTSYGASLGHLFGGLIGFEEDFGYAPDFYGQSTNVTNNSVLTLMSNVVVALPVPMFKPYVSGGLGLMRSHSGLNSTSVNIDDNALGYDIGGGLMMLLPAHLGVRFDFRYLRSSSDISVAGVTLPFADLHFNRLSVGLVLH
jgi:opacity protein-like surface antigen